MRKTTSANQPGKRQTRQAFIRALLLTACLAAIPAHATDAFLKIPGVTGESLAPSHIGEIDVLAWSWGMTNSGTMHLGGGGGRGYIQDLTITKRVDRASPALMRNSCRGNMFASAILTIQGSIKTTEYYRITLTNILVKQYSTSGTIGSDHLEESVSLNFASFKMDYVYYAPSGSFSQRSGLSWNITNNVGSAFTNQPERVAPFVASLSFQAGSTQATLQWPSVPGRQYQVLFTEDMLIPFTPLNTYPAGTAEIMSIPVPSSLARGFFKVNELTN